MSGSVDAKLYLNSVFALKRCAGSPVCAHVASANAMADWLGSGQSKRSAGVCSAKHDAGDLARLLLSSAERSVPDQTPALRLLCLIGWEAAKANAAPAFVLQSMMLAILLAYYFHPPSAAFLNALAGFKERHGLAFVLIASAIVGAILPELFVIVFFQRGRIQLQNARNSIFNAPFWAFDGFLVNLMYRGLAEWLGNRTSVPIVAAKICLD